MMKKNTRITSIEYDREKKRVILYLSKQIPPFGYSSQEMVKLLKEWRPEEWK